MKEKKHTHGFNTPKDYFETFEDGLFSKLKEDQLSNESGFAVPDGYFDQLEETLLERLKTDSEPVKVVSLFSRKTILYGVAIAACLALIITVALPKDPGPGDFEDLQLSNIESYIDAGNLNWDSYDVAALMTDEELEAISLETELFSEESLEDYLLNNLDDSTLLIE